MKHVACGIMCNEYNQIMLGKRHSKGPYPNIWEFPGGKLEEGETLEECLIREWQEELNLSIAIDTKLITIVSVTGKNTICHFFIGRIMDLPNLQINVHECVDFFYPKQMKKLKLFKEDNQIVDMLISMFSR
jgi:8-oxo-dGTP pyrophosphatase MutT (NUDIX family)